MPRASTGDPGRLRRGKRRIKVTKPNTEFVNPYPWMSSVEAMVHLELERREVPFSWRYFDGESALLSELMPDFTPEFTLREYKAVILVIGLFWGTLPGVLDKNALCKVLLEAEGWTVVTLFEQDIRSDVAGALDRALPQLKNPAIKGKPRPNPYGQVDLMAARRQQIAAVNAARKQWMKPASSTRSTAANGESGRSRRRSRSRLRRRAGR